MLANIRDAISHFLGFLWREIKTTIVKIEGMNFRSHINISGALRNFVPNS